MPTTTIETDELTLTETATDVHVTIPVALLRRAQVARSEAYGSNDDEHDALAEILDLALAAAGDPGYSTWTIHVDVPERNTLYPLTSDERDAVLASIVDFADTVSDASYGQVWRFTAHVDEETLGVAQRTARDLLAAVRIHINPDARITAVDRAQTEPGAPAPVPTLHPTDTVQKVLNEAADEIAERAGLPDSGPRDALNLLVNATVLRLAEPDKTLDAVISEAYQEKPQTVLDWCTE